MFGAHFSSDYLLVRAFAADSGQRARITSPSVSRPSDKGYCLSFYYHMIGMDLGSLSVSAVPTDGGDEKMVYRLNGTRGEDWIHAHVNMQLAEYNFDFSLAFDVHARKKIDGS